MKARLRLVRLLGLRWIRVHPLRTSLAVVAVAGGVSIAMSVLLTLSSVSWSFAHFDASIAGGATLRVIGATARGGLEAKVASDVASTAGVFRAIPVVQAVTTAWEGRHSAPVIVVGVDSKNIPPGLALGSQVAVVPGSARGGSNSDATGSGPPSALVSGILARRLDLPVPPDTAASGASGVSGAAGAAGAAGGARTGPARSPSVASSEGRTELGGITVVPALNRIAGGDVVVMDLPAAQALFARSGRLDAVYVVPARGVATGDLRQRLERVVGNWNGVVPAGSLPPDVSVVTQAFIPLLGLLGVLAIAVAVVLVHDIVDLALAERRQQVAIVSALGGTPATAMLPLVEVGVVGLAGGVLGVVGGAVAARTIVGTLDHLIHRLSGVSLNLHVGVLAAIAAPLGGLVVAASAAAGPLRRSRHVDVAAELSGRDAIARARAKVVGWRAGVTSAVTLAGLGGCVVSARHGGLAPWQYPAGVASFGLVVLGGTLAVGSLAPVLIEAVRRVAGRSAGRGRPSLAMALANLVRNPNRTGTMAVAVAGAVGIAFVAASFNRSVTTAIVDSAKVGTSRWVYVSMGGTASVSINSEERFSPAYLANLGRVPGVSRIVRQVGVITGHSSSEVVGVETSDDLRVTGIPVIEGRNDPFLLRSGEAMVGAALARRQHLRPGSFARLDTPRGIARVKVAGIWQSGDFNGSSAFISQEVMQRLYGAQPPTNVYVYPRPGISADLLAQRIAAAHVAPDLHVATPAQTTAAYVRSSSGQIAPFWTLQHALMVLSFVAVLSTFVLAGAQRRKEYGALVAVGFTPAGLGRLVVAEGALVGVAGSVLGGLLGVVATAALITVVPLVIGYRDPFVLAPDYLLVYGLFSVAITVGASALPAWRAASVPVLEALREE